MDIGTRNLDAIAQLADELKFYWSVLHTAVRLSRSWHPNLTARYVEAEQDALRLGRKLAGGARPIATLADLRVLSVEQIEGALERMTDSLGTTLDDDPPLARIRQLIADVTETARLLLRGVDIGSCRCTDTRNARRRLVTRLGRDEDTERLLDAADELAGLACVEAERLLTECVKACRAGRVRIYGQAHRLN